MTREQRREISEEITRGLRKLAFSKPAKGVRIERGEQGETELVLEKIDPFHIAEIRQNKSGMELKFYSRIDAMLRLAELCTAEPEDFYATVPQGEVWSEQGDAE